MSFFFYKAGNGATAPAGERLPKPNRQSTQTLNRLGCAACPLNKAPVHTPKMTPTLAKGADVYFMAEAPGRHEDETSHKPLTGPSGQLLRGVLHDVRRTNGIGADHSVYNIDDLSFDNVINCRPEDNRTPVWQEIECCRPRRVKYIEEAKPKLIVGLGAIPLQWALGSTDLAGMRGRVFAIKIGQHSCHFMPTYHPSFILRVSHNKQKPLNSKLGHCFRMDIKRALQIASALEPVHIDTEAEIRSGIEVFDGSSPDHYGRLCTLLADADRAKVKAIDIETRGLRPFGSGAALMSVALSYDRYNISFAIAHPSSAFSTIQRDGIKGLLQQLVACPNKIKISHNAPFEIEWFIWWLGRDVVDHASWECTQMQAHFIDERRGQKSYGDSDRRAPYQSLDFLCKQHFGINFKSLFKVNKKDMSKSDLREMLVYNAVDTKYTLRLYHKQKALLKQQGLLEAYEDAIARQPTVALMQTLGVQVDQKEVKRCQTKLEGEVKNIEAQINDLEAVKSFKKQRSEFNPLSDKDVITLLKDYLRCKEVIIKEGTKVRYSADKHVLAKIKHPIAPLLIDLRNRSKLKSTYVDCLEAGKGVQVYPDGKIHCNFNTTFTETGRTSSDEPNMQNFPKRQDAWVRKQIVAPPGHLLVAVDYGQLEACTVAMCSKDEYLVKALWEDYDTHMEWAEKTERKIPGLAKGNMKAFRSLIKNKLTFPAFFGAANESIRDYLAAACDVDVQQVDVDDLMDEFWSTFKGTKAWQDRLMKDYYERGYVSTLVGRRHRYPLTRNEAINAPVQGTAAELVCDAMCRLSSLCLSSGQWHLHPLLNIHDDLTFAVPEKLLDSALETIIKEMLTFDYPWINVPLSCEVSIGKNWYQLKSLGKFWSHKDV